MSTKKSVKKSVKKSAKKVSKASSKVTKAAVVQKRTKAPKRAVAKAAQAPKRTAAKRTEKKATVASAADFMAHAYAMEAEAAERYAEFADSMEMHNNLEVAELFRKLSRIEQRHADQILEQMGWKQSPVSSANVRWEGMEGPETADPTELHYLMQPYHALQIALHNEKRARDFFAHLARVTKDAGVRKGALEMEEDEAEHVRLIEDWLKRTPKPDPNWETDQDPPVLSD
ncbi:MAG: ferritin-like domain-containing protein [Burkholderiales bacterium]